MTSLKQSSISKARAIDYARLAVRSYLVTDKQETNYGTLYTRKGFHAFYDQESNLVVRLNDEGVVKSIYPY